jgi:hypothetical protein
VCGRRFTIAVIKRLLGVKQAELLTKFSHYLVLILEFPKSLNKANVRFRTHKSKILKHPTWNQDSTNHSEAAVPVFW